MVAIFFLVIFLIFNCRGQFINSGTPSGVPASFDCAVREFAWQYGMNLMPNRGQFRTLFDALQLQACGLTPPSQYDQWTPPTYPANASATNYYVDATKGNDNNNGALNTPFQTIPKAITSCRTATVRPCIINLRAGTFYLASTLLLNQQDSNLIIQNYNGESAIISGGKLLNGLTWKSWNVTTTPSWVVYNGVDSVYGRTASKTSNHAVTYLGTFNTTAECQSAVTSSSSGPFLSFTYFTTNYSSNFSTQCFGVKDSLWTYRTEANVVSGKLVQQNVWVADVSSFRLTGIPGLRVNGRRAIRARYPNSDPEIGMQFVAIDGWNSVPTTWAKPTVPATPAVEIIINATNYADVDWPMSLAGGSQWSGLGDWGNYAVGLGGYCENVSPPYGFWCQATTTRGCCPHQAPSGFTYKGLLQNLPYKFANQAVIHAWRPSHWFTWMWEIQDVQASEFFNFTKGGYQGSQGSASGGEWWIDNVYEELESQSEWFYSPADQLLYFFPNGSIGNKNPPPATDEFVVTNLKYLINATATQSSPIRDLTIRGLTFRDTAYVYMDAHGFPSGGDWGLHRGGALFFEGTQSLKVDNNLFTRIDNTAVFLSGYHRNATISQNEFVWIGDNAIASWGKTTSKDARIPLGEGPDGRNGDQPHFTQITNNLIHEIGIWQKQSSFYFQAVSAQNTISRNVFFNGPRAAINENDGFGGANEITENLIINSCRESGDHGPWNSWDRIPYITTVRNGTASIVPEINRIHRNFIIGNYQSSQAIDNDDGSANYNTSNNFFVYANQGLKSDFGGNRNRHYNNLYAYVSAAWGIQNNSGSGNMDEFFSNRVVLRTANSGYASDCNTIYEFKVYNNSVFTSSGTLNCCNTTLPDWVAGGHDKGSTVAIWPSDATIIDWAKQLLS